MVDLPLDAPATIPSDAPVYFFLHKIGWAELLHNYVIM